MDDTETIWFKSANLVVNATDLAFGALHGMKNLWLLKLAILGGPSPRRSPDGVLHRAEVPRAFLHAQAGRRRYQVPTGRRAVQRHLHRSPGVSPKSSRSWSPPCRIDQCEGVQHVSPEVQFFSVGSRGTPGSELPRSPEKLQPCTLPPQAQNKVNG